MSTPQFSTNYTAFGCTIKFMPHAIQRMEERFGFDDLLIPNRRMVKANEKVADGEEFHISTSLCKFVCKRDAEGELAVVTVLFTV